jgi:ABC-type amino acid transport substrate-binding protein
MKAALIFEKDGDYILSNSNTRTVADIVQGKLIADFLVEDNTLFNTYPPGHIKAGSRNFEDINKGILAKKIKELTELYENVEAARGAKTNLLTTLNFLEEWLNANNFNINVDTLIKVWNPQRADKETSWNNIKDVVVKLQRIYKEFENGKNPFLHLKPQEILVNNKKINKDLIVDLATTLKPGLDKEYQASYINAEKKSEYSIRLANHLTKMTAHFKDKKKLVEYLGKIAKDPLLSKMPLLQDLIVRDDNRKPKLNSKGEIQLTDNAAEFDVQTFDALSRSGKKRAVPYKDLSDIEMEAVNLAFFHNNGTEALGYYKLPIPSDATSIPYVKMAKLTEEQVVNKLTTVAEGEIARINYLKGKKIKLLKLIPNYYTRGQKFQVLSFLNGKIDPNNYTKEQLAEVIGNYLKGDFFTKEKLKFLKTGVIDKINTDGSIVFAPKVLTKKVAAQGQEFFYNYLINQYYANSQLTTLLSGDPSFYKNTTDYQKRNKQIVSPGELTDALKKGVKPTYKGVILKDSEVPLKDTVLKNILKIIEDSKLDKTTKTELTALWKSKTHNESDAATFISPERYREILRSLNEWTEAHDKAFERIEDGVESIEDIALFPPLKPFQYTKRYVEDVEIPTQVKNSEMLLTKSFAAKYPKLRAIYEAMENGTIDTAIFESAVKVGAVGEYLDKNGNVQFSEVIQTEQGLQLSPNANILEFNQEDWKLQNRTPAHYVDDMGNYGTQLRHLMIADLELTDEKKYNGQSGKEIAREYQELIIENLKESLESVKNLFLLNKITLTLLN